MKKPVALFLKEIGTPVGNKTRNPFKVPIWVMKGSRETKAAYLRGIFTTEGSIFPTRTKVTPRWRIGIEMYKWDLLKNEGKIFMEQIKELLEEFEIKSSPVRFGRTNQRMDGTYSIAVKLDIESKQFDKFYKEVGFDDIQKTQKLLGFLAERQDHVIRSAEVPLLRL